MSVVDIAAHRHTHDQQPPRLPSLPRSWTMDDTPGSPAAMDRDLLHLGLLAASPTILATHDMLGWDTAACTSVGTVDLMLGDLPQSLNALNQMMVDKFDHTDHNGAMGPTTPSLSWCLASECDIERELRELASTGGDEDNSAHFAASLDMDDMAEGGSPPQGDSGVDGDMDDSSSDVSSDVSSECGGRGRGVGRGSRDSVFLPQLPKLDRTKHGAPSTRTAQHSAHPRPRSGEALVASITPWEREMLLSKFGMTVPDQLPLTKLEDRKLRGVLRKIRNKVSAQRSRRNKETYIDGLEKRVEECTRINVELGTKVTRLEEDNRSLLEQLDDLRRTIARQATSSGGAGVTLMMAVVCVGLQTAELSGGADGPASYYASSGSPSFQSRTLKSFPGDVPVDDMMWATTARAVIAAVIFALVLFWHFAPRRLALPPPFSWWWGPKPGRFQQ